MWAGQIWNQIANDDPWRDVLAFIFKSKSFLSILLSFPCLDFHLQSTGHFPSNRWLYWKTLLHHRRIGGRCETGLGSRPSLYTNSSPSLPPNVHKFSTRLFFYLNKLMNPLINRLKRSESAKTFFRINLKNFSSVRKKFNPIKSHGQHVTKPTFATKRKIVHIRLTLKLTVKEKVQNNKALENLLFEWIRKLRHLLQIFLVQ